MNIIVAILVTVTTTWIILNAIFIKKETIYGKQINPECPVCQSKNRTYLVDKQKIKTSIAFWVKLNVIVSIITLLWFVPLGIISLLTLMQETFQNTLKVIFEASSIQLGLSLSTSPQYILLNITTNGYLVFCIILNVILHALFGHVKKSVLVCICNDCGAIETK